MKKIKKMGNKFEYHDSSYFDSNSTYMFKDLREFESKVFFENGYWWTVEGLNYKANTILCYKIK